MNTKIRILFILSCLFAYVDIQAQTQTIPCGTAELMEKINTSAPGSEIIKDRIYHSLQRRAPIHQSSATQSAPDTIPVIVHVLWTTANMNISDSLIVSEIAKLNADFSKLNADTVNIPLAFQPLASSMPIFLCLAKRDPNGLPTTGIVRRQTNHGTFTFPDALQTNTGGDDAWNSDYLNIYCCDVDNNYSGFGLLNSNACMVDFEVFGIPSIYSRTGTHEVGHTFGLLHTWGPEVSTGPFTCSQDDGIADTPPQYGPSSLVTCPTFPSLDSCTAAGNGIMYTNYMNYSSMGCPNMFSAGQVSSMLNSLNSSLSDYLTSKGCKDVPVHDAGCLSVLPSLGGTCSSVIPILKIKNFGTDTLNSLTINYHLDAGAVNTYNWNGALSILDSAIVTLPVFIVPPGSHQLFVYCTNPDGITDPDNTNDTVVITVQADTLLGSPLVEGFEGSLFPPEGWKINNPSANNTFIRSTNASYSGTASMMIDNHPITAVATYDEFITHLNLTNIQNPVLTFALAYTYSTSGGFPDSLAVFVSDDCGSTYDRVYYKYSTALLTTPPISGINFIPTPSQWRVDTVDLSAYANSSEIIIKFYNFSFRGLQLYIDDINLQNIVGIGELNISEPVKLFPNPNTGHFILEIPDNKSAELTIINSIGRIMFEKHEQGKTNIPIDCFLEKGVYLLIVKTPESITRKKFIVE